MQVIIFAAILATVYAGNLPYRSQSPQQTLYNTPVQQGSTYGGDYRRYAPYNGGFYYGYKSPDGRSNQQAHGELRGDTQTVEGAYSFYAPNGALAETQYIADQYGYRARTSQTHPGYRQYQTPTIKQYTPPRNEYLHPQREYYYGRPQY